MNRLPLTAALAALAVSAIPLAGTAQAQNIEGPRMAPESTLLSVDATGKVSSKPDVATFLAGVATTGKTAGEALSANSVAMNRVISALKKTGVADRDIQTSNLNVQPVYANNNSNTPRPVDELEDQTPRIVGYRANNQVIVKQRNLKDYGKVIDTLVSSGANQVSGPDFQITQEDAALDTARRDAVAKARARAQLYASAAGLQVKRIVSINEGSSYRPAPQMAYARAAMDKAESTPVEAGEVELQVNVSVVFELAP